MAAFLESQNIDILFCIGGDGTQRGAHSLAQEINRRGLKIAVMGIPKTIDNDINLVDPSFGYYTAIQEATKAILCAHNEARSHERGIGLVKVMGRHAGFIAAGATMASQTCNFTLVPEVAFPLEGKDGLLELLYERLKTRDHVVVLVAEGAGQHHIHVEVR